MSDIYEHHKAAFSQVSAYIIIDPATAERVATVAIRFPKDGLRLWAYVHLIGVPMVRAAVGGGGYDKSSAAVERAIEKITCEERFDASDAYAVRCVENMRRLKAAAMGMERDDWTRCIEREGYRVLQAV